MTIRYGWFFLALLAVLVCALPSQAQSGLGAGTLGSLMTPRGGKLEHFASTDAKGGTGDFRPVAPGETFTLVDYKGGPGIVRRWWITIAPRNNVAIQRQAIIRCYWDGETMPSVECPVSDFFGMGFGEWRDFQSLPLNMTSGGYNCYWPMPFHKSARITIENRSKVRIDSFYYNLEVETHKQLPKDSLYFHAQFRRSRPTEQGKPYILLETTGKGQYVGTLLSMQPMRGRGLGYLEGDEQVTVDGEASPSILGTGTEDYFSSGWYYDTGVYSAPYHGVTIKDVEKGRISTYRWHIEDVIPFEKSLRFAIEHGPVNDIPGDYSSVAFYYQTHPHPPFPPLPVDLLPFEPAPVSRIDGMIEGESRTLNPRATQGKFEVQTMESFSGTWSGEAHLWWKPEAPGARLTVTVSAPAAGSYDLVGYFTQAPDYGDIKIRLNGSA
ncbi:MAG: glycoside hydrolase family 172 protein, partial [Armatimonadota bacterium]